QIKMCPVAWSLTWPPLRWSPSPARRPPLSRSRPPHAPLSGITTTPGLWVWSVRSAPTPWRSCERLFVRRRPLHVVRRDTAERLLVLDRRAEPRRGVRIVQGRRDRRPCPPL